MPFIILCANTWCDKLADDLGKLCKDCQRKADQEARDWRAVGWTRYQDNESARNGHKGAKKDGRK